MLLSTLATAATLLLALLAKVLTRDWCHPAVVFCLLWGGSSSVAILLAPEDMASATGSLWILLNAAFVVAGGVLGTALATNSTGGDRGDDTAASSVSRRVRQFVREDGFDSRLRSHAKASIFLGLLFVPLCLRSQGIGVGQLLSFAGIVKTAFQMSLMRYTNTGTAIPNYVEVFLSFSYVAPLLGGALFVRRRRSSDLGLSLLTLLPCTAAFAVQSTKASVLYGATLWLAGYLAGRTYEGRRVPRLRLHVLAPTLLAVPLVVLFLVAGEALRGGRTNLPGAGTLMTGRMKTQLVGHLPALSQWMDTHELGEVSPAWGRYTFAGLYQYAHAGARVNGVYGESVVVPTGVTNVYTYFRQTIEDYTRPGALLLMFSLAVFGGFAYAEVLARMDAWTGVLAACHAGTLFGITSIFNYNSLVLALVLYAFWDCAQKQTFSDRAPVPRSLPANA